MINFLSVCIPTYEMGDHGADFLRHSLNILSKQSFKDFEVVISDHSKSGLIKEVCGEFKGKLDIHYFHNHQGVGSSSANINNAIRHAKGRLIKILFQDDYLFSDNSLQDIVQNFDLQEDCWLITASEHTTDGVHLTRPFFPKYNDNIYLGNNTISSPSVLTIKNDNPLLFDEKLVWLMDVDYYKRCYDCFGPPKILSKINVVNRVGSHQVSETLTTKKLKDREYRYVLKKFGKPKESSFKTRGRLQLPMVTLVAVSSVNLSKTTQALTRSMAGIDFGEVVLISHLKPPNLPNSINFRRTPKIKNIEDYSRFMTSELARYIGTDYALIVQYDGYVVRPEQWDDKFLEYDYIGAPWSKNLHFTNEGVNVRVGNGGFSLRSRKMLEAPNILKLPFTDNGTGYWNEDGILCVYYRKELERYGIKYAPVNIAARFSLEAEVPESIHHSFGFHKNTNAWPMTFSLKHRLRELWSAR